MGRIGDRLFIGAAADNQGQRNREAMRNDWLSQIMGSTSIGAWATWTSTFAAISRFGSTGITETSRTSDSQEKRSYMGFVPLAIGVAAWDVADGTQNPATATAYACCGQGWRMAGVDYQPSFVMELETVNIGGRRRTCPRPTTPIVVAAATPSRSDRAMVRLKRCRGRNYVRAQSVTAWP